MSEYAKITHQHPNILVRYPHQKRLEILTRMIAACDRSSWLDFGSGDGEIFNSMRSAGMDVSSAEAYEPVEEMLQALAANLGVNEGDQRGPTVSGSVPEGQYSLVTAFEVLEHLPLPERVAFYRMLVTQTCGARDCLIEVPVEFGPILAVKASGRMLLKQRDREYSTRELLASALLGRVDDHHNRYDPSDTRTFISPHQGFDYRRLEAELQTVGEIISVERSPFARLPAVANQCVVFHLRVTATDPSSLDDLLEPRVHSEV